jgi:5S rRNA maturation endonuclease (ribonuclease M5)
MKLNKQKRLAPFVEFLSDFIAELNTMSEEGWAVLVEGPRDVKAMSGLGYRGPIITVSALTRDSNATLRQIAGVVILTDMDREGRQLAARCTRKLSHEGIQTSLIQRRRLLAASRGLFRHVENLSRFEDQLAG